MLSRYPLNLIKMNNTSLLCITAAAGTKFSQDHLDKNLSLSDIYLELYKT